MTQYNASLDDRKVRHLLRELTKRGSDKPADTIKWYDELSDDDSRTLLIGLQVAFVEMAQSVANLSRMTGVILGAAVRDIELRNRGSEES